MFKILNNKKKYFRDMLQYDTDEYSENKIGILLAVSRKNTQKFYPQSR
jgi:hypothetical protein